MDTNWNPELVKEIKKGDEVDLPWLVRTEWVRRAIRKIVKPDLLSVNIEVAPGLAERLIAKGWPIFLWVPDGAGHPGGPGQEALRRDLRRAAAREGAAWSMSSHLRRTNSNPDFLARVLQLQVHVVDLQD